MVTTILAVGRILLGGYFVYSGIKHFIGLNALTGYAQSKKVPLPKIAVVVTGIMMLLGGLSILIGYFVALGILILIVFLVITTFVMHRYWNVTDPMQKMGEQINFMKNLAIVGALLILFPIAPLVLAPLF